MDSSNINTHMQHFYEVVQHNSKYILEISIGGFLLILSQLMPKFLFIPMLLLSVGNYTQDIQAITLILSGISFSLTIIKVGWEIIEKYTKKNKKK